MPERWSTREHYPVLWEWAHPYAGERCERCGAEGAVPFHPFNTRARFWDLCAACRWQLAWKRWNALPRAAKEATWDRLSEALGPE